MTLVKNASSLPKRYFGLHMVEGVAEYVDPQENGGKPYRLLLSEDVLKAMDKTYDGRPVYVEHVDDVNLSNVEQESAGYVVRSFYNPPDGKHWVEFLVVSDEGHEAIAKKWKLSNAYKPKQYGAGGKWHNVEYLKEVMEAEYDHLAIVPNPRYEESIILTPEEFKQYNSEKEKELRLLANSKEKTEMGLKFWERKKVENAAALESTVVELKSGKTLTIADLVKNAEEHEEKKANEEKEKAEGKKPMANGEHMVKVGDDTMTVNELIAKHQELMEKHESGEAMGVRGKKDDDDDDSGEVSKHDDDAEDPSEDEEALAKAKELEEHERKELAEKKKNAKEKAAKVRNAGPKAPVELPVSLQRDGGLELSSEQVARGKSRYGSN